MRINTEIIEKLKPCEDRFNNYLKYYKDFDGTLEDFILLDNITYNDKVWVVTRLFTKEQNVKWAILCASKVLSIFENKYPNDKRPRKALEAAEKWLLNPNEKNRLTVSYAATSVYYDTFSTSCAERAATSAIFAACAACAVDTATNKACADFTSCAAYDAIFAESDSGFFAGLIEQEVNLILMLECL